MTHSIFSSWSLEADHHWPNKSSDSNRWWNISISAFSVPLLSFASVCYILHEANDNRGTENADMMKYLHISVFSSSIVICFVSYLPYRSSSFILAHIASQRALSWHHHCSYSVWFHDGLTLPDRMRLRTGFPGHCVGSSHRPMDWILPYSLL